MMIYTFQEQDRDTPLTLRFDSDPLCTDKALVAISPVWSITLQCLRVMILRTVTSQSCEIYKAADSYLTGCLISVVVMAVPRRS